jgi:hypothetical protein
MLRILALAAALTASASLAAAQPLYADQRGTIYERPPARPYAQQQPYEPLICQRWCPADSSPCDPPYFKAADGRCSSRTRF